MERRPDDTSATGSGSIEDRLREARLPPLPRTAWLEIDLSALAANARTLRSLLPTEALLGAVVKADGYGHGMLAAVHAAFAGGAHVLCVATLDEALELRRAGAEARILLLFAVPPMAVEDAFEAGLELAVMDDASLDALMAGVRRRPPGGPPARVHLGVDTGMTRGGILPADVVAAARRLLDAGLPRLAGTWSHLASPEDRDATARQVAAFRTVLADLDAAGIEPGLRHVIATGGLLDDVSPTWDLARIGLALYGHVPRDVRVAPERRAAVEALRPVLRLQARAISIETVPPGTGVGYGGTWRAERASRIAILPVGYGDGWARGYADGALGRVRGLDVPLVGRVSMDAIAIDVTDVPGFGHADEVTLIAPPREGGSTIDELAERRGSIAWEVLASFGPRLPRVYLEDGRVVGVRYLDGALALVPGFAFRLAPADQSVETRT